MWKRRLLIGSILFAGIVIAIFYFENNKVIRKTYSLKPPKITDVGPTAQDIDISRKIGKYIVHVKAKKDFFLKEKNILMFKTNLMKVIVARDVKLTILKDSKEEFVFKKKKVTLKPDLGYIAIPYPVVVFPGDFKQPYKVVVDFKRSKITLYYKNFKKKS